MSELLTTLAPALAAARLGPLGESIDLIFDQRIGIVRNLQEVAVEPGAPQFFHYAAEACNTNSFVALRNFHNTGGAALTREGAIAKAIGEAVERYSAAIFDPDEMPISSYRDAGFRTVNPTDFALHSAEQYARPGFPWVRFSAETPVRWSPAMDLATGETIHVPAPFVWIPYRYAQGSGDMPIVQPISTGLACHGSAAMASLSGLCEVIERDSFTLAWQSRMAPPHVRVETLPDHAYEMVKRLEAPGDRVVIIDITTDNGVWCFLAILCSEAAERPAFVFAAAASLDPASAVSKALEELAHTRRYSQQIKRFLPPVSAANDWEDVTSQMDHLNFAADHGNRGLISFIFTSRVRINFADYQDNSTDDPKSDLRQAVQRVLATGHRVYRADLTSEDVRQLGLHVHRVIVPGYHPLFMGFTLRSLGGRRISEVPKLLGYTEIAPGRDNPAPHPYP